MRLRILPATVDRTPGQGLSGYILNDRIAIDAGPLGLAGTVDEQAKVEHVLLTHSHIDHVAGLPMLLDNLYGGPGCCPTVYGSKATLDSLQTDVFNDRLMPDFIAMSARMTPFLSVKEIEAGKSFVLGELTITPIAVVHSVPTLGYFVEDDIGAFGLFTDTLPIPDVLQALATNPRLKAVFLECSFPRRLQRLAEVSFHHSTSDFLEAAKNLPAHVAVYPIHIKPRFHDEIVRELTEAGLPNLRIVQPGATIRI